MHARYYTPAWGRFLSVDPELDVSHALHNPQGWNRYAYVENKPITLTDPNGRCATVLSCAWILVRYVAPTLARMAVRETGRTIVTGAGTYYVQRATTFQYAKPVVIPTQLAEGIYEFPDAQEPGKTYVGQSEDTDRRLEEHEASGKKDPETEATVTEVRGGKTARAHAEQNRINELGGKKAVPGSQTSNKVNPVGPKRQTKVEQFYGPIKPPRPKVVPGQ